MSRDRVDFESSRKLNKEELKVFALLHENAGYVLATGLSGALRSIVEVVPDGLTQVPFAEFVGGMKTLTFVAVCSLPPLEGTALIEIDLPLLFSLVDRSLGGKGGAQAGERELTDIEKIIGGRISSRILEALRQSLASSIAVRPSVISCETNPQFIRTATQQETALLAAYKMTAGTGSGGVRVCMPLSMAEPLIKKLSQGGPSKNPDKTVSRESLERRLGAVSVPLVAYFGAARATLREILGMRQGDVIRLAPDSVRLARVVVKGRQTFTARVGTSRNKRALKIVGVQER